MDIDGHSHPRGGGRDGNSDRGEHRSAMAGRRHVSRIPFFANLDVVSEFKATSSGFEARTREVVQRAESAIDELQILAEQVATLSLSLVKRQGRLGRYTDDEEEKICNDVLTVLAKLGVSSERLPSILGDWHRLTAFDYAFGILGGNFVPAEAGSDVIKEWKALRSRSVPASPEQIRGFLEAHEYANDARKELVADYEFYLSHRTHRRPDIWRERENWGNLQR